LDVEVRPVAVVVDLEVDRADDVDVDVEAVAVDEVAAVLVVVLEVD
jgi:hypothetical protein